MPICVRLHNCGMATVLCAVTGAAGSTSSEPKGPWRLERDGMRLEMQSLTTDQSQAFLIGRGFTRAEAERIANAACLFRAAIGNSVNEPGGPGVGVSLGEWRSLPAAGPARPLMTREDWDRIVASRDVKEDAAVALHWALFPTEQTFGPGDYNWGFLSFGLPPGSRFSLELNWRTGERQYRARFDDLECSS